MFYDGHPENRTRIDHLVLGNGRGRSTGILLPDRRRDGRQQPGADPGTDPETDSDSGSDVGTGPGPTWGHCGASLVLTHYTADCNGDGIPNMTERPGGSLIDSNPNDGWEAIYTDDEKSRIDEDGAANLSFLPVTISAVAPYTYSNVTRYKGPPIRAPQEIILHSTEWGSPVPVEFVRCQIPSGCGEDARWSAANPTILDTGDYVRLRIPAPNISGQIVPNLQVVDDYYAWEITSTLGDLDGDGFTDDVDPDPRNPLIPAPAVPSNEAQYWRVAFSNFRHFDNSLPAHPHLPYFFSEIKVTFEGGSSTNKSDTPDVDVLTSPNRSGDNLVDENHDTEWEMPAPEAGMVTFEIPTSRKAISYSWIAGESWTHWARYTANIELQSSQDGRNWTTHDRQFNAHIGYSDGETYQVRQN